MIALRGFSTHLHILATGAIVLNLLGQEAAAQPAGLNVQSATAESFEIRGQILLDTSCWRCAPRFSPDGKKLAFVVNRKDPKTGAGLSEIRIVELPTGRLQTSVSTAQELSQVVWSPDGTRLLTLPYSGRGNIAVVIVGTRELIPIGSLTQYISESDEIYWTEPETVYFLSNASGSDRFSLATLTSEWLGNLKQEAFEALRLKLSASPLDHPKVVLRVRGQMFEAANREGSLIKELQYIYSRPMTFSRDAAYAVIEDSGSGQRTAGEGLRLLILGAARTPTMVAASIQPMPLTAESSELAALQKRLQSGAPVFASIRPARKNPLNGRFVAPTGDVKATVQILSVTGDILKARMVRMHLNGGLLKEDAVSELIGPEPIGTADIKFSSIAALVADVSFSQ